MPQNKSEKRPGIITEELLTDWDPVSSSAEKESRRQLQYELNRLTEYAVTGLLECGLIAQQTTAYATLPETGEKRFRYDFDWEELETIARQVLRNDSANSSTILAAQIAIVLPELHFLYQHPEPTWRLANWLALCTSMCPDPIALQRARRQQTSMAAKTPRFNRPAQELVDSIVESLSEPTRSEAGAKKPNRRVTNKQALAHIQAHYSFGN